ncbi:MAG: hypothetical protein H0T45_03965 [Pyrinomonadaceae bacterium]|nr:hypothetical protein [Pyrinomonadaceae bacterium]
MSEKKSKYDTDPLDPNFARRTEEMTNEATRELARTPNEQARRHEQAEAPTRLMDETIAQSYPSIFAPPTYQPPAIHTAPPPAAQPSPPLHAPPNAYAPPPAPFNPAERHVAGLNVAEKFAVVAPYAPFYIGLVAGLVELLLVPRREGRTRFHAAQGLALQLAFVAIDFALGFISIFGRIGPGRSLVWLAAFIFLLYSMVRVWRGEQHRLAPLDDATRWLNERIDPRKK